MTIKREEIIAVIDREEENRIISIVVRRIKRFLKIKYNLNVKHYRIDEVIIEIKYSLLEKSNFEIINSERLYIILGR